jgi:hypothetical protein
MLPDSAARLGIGRALPARIWDFLGFLAFSAYSPLLRATWVIHDET